MTTRIALLDSAESAIRRRGYNGFSYADLAHDVGIRKASIHHHFPTKPDLALALIERYADHFSENLSTIRAKSGAAAQQLRAYHEVYREALQNGDQVCLCVSLSAGRDSLTDPVLDQLKRFHTDSIAWLKRVFAEAVTDKTVSGLAASEHEASAALALMEGAQLIARAAKDVALFDQSTAAFLARLSPQDAL